MDLITYLQTTTWSTIGWLITAFFCTPYWMPDGYDLEAKMPTVDLDVSLFEIAFQIVLVSVSLLAPFRVSDGDNVSATYSLITALVITCAICYPIRRMMVKSIMVEMQQAISLREKKKLREEEEQRWLGFHKTLTSLSGRIHSNESQHICEKLIELLPRLRECERQIPSIKWKILISSIERICEIEEGWIATSTARPDDDLMEACLKALESTASRIAATVEVAEAGDRDRDRAKLEAIQVQQSIHA